MIRAVAIISIMLMLSACVSVPVPSKGPLIVRAIPKSSDSTGWYRDFCTFGQPVNNKDIYYGDSCKSRQILHHAFLNKVRLSNVHSLSGAYYGNDIYAGMSGGQRVFWTQNNREQGYFILQRVELEFTKKTGINFLMTPVSYNKNLQCVVSFGYYPHSDFRACPDEKFHEGHYDDCLPINKVLEHFANG
ncbi:hypothetical protein [Aliikangiella sp. G2MR2-5]|uniref:hypothetical protein n=1 Tax=Aliikangiella sp. G2MR2-5 TaxID=2788943 RepID=UPI0018ABB465|nr:hypothetical protein [Aliikangiella sp. G2MR2-5]